jgi:hypothetical protein
MKSNIRTAAVLAAATFVLGTGKAWAGVGEVKGERGHRVAVFVEMPPATGHDPAGAQPAVTFTRHDNQYWLADVWDSAHEGVAVR